MVVAAAAKDCSERTNSREAGTTKCAASAARSTHCSINTSLSEFSQSTCTACEMQPDSVRERCTCSRLSRRTSSKVSCRAVTLPVTMIIFVALKYCLTEVEPCPLLSPLYHGKRTSNAQMWMSALGHKRNLSVQQESRGRCRA